MGSTSGGVGDNGVEVERIELIDHPPCQNTGGHGLSVVCMERSAARLHGGSHDFAAVGQQDIGGVPVDVGKDQILHAAGKKAHAVALDSLWGLDGTDHLMGKARENAGCLRLECAEPARQ